VRGGVNASSSAAPTGGASRLLSKNIKIRIYKTIILPVVLYLHETWSLTLREQHGLRVFEKRDEVQKTGENCIMKNAYRMLVGKPEGRKRPLGRPRHRWVDNTEMDLREIGWSGMDWINLAKHRDQWRALVNTVMKLCVP
jgi:hypothetical protein